MRAVVLAAAMMLAAHAHAHAVSKAWYAVQLASASPSAAAAAALAAASTGGPSGFTPKEAHGATRKAESAASRESAAGAPAWATRFSDGAVLQRLVDDAVASGAPSVALPSGNFSFGAKAFVVRGARWLRVGGAGVGPDNGTHLWFEPGFGVELLSCEAVTFEGVTTDTLTPPFSQGTLVSVDVASRTIVVDVDEGFPTPDGPLFNQTCADGGPGRCGEVKMIYWDPATRLIVQGQQMNSPMAGAVCHAGSVGAEAGTSVEASSAAPPASTAAAARCTVTSIPPIAWLPPPWSLVTLSPRVGASRYPIPSYYKGTLFVFNSTSCVLQDIDTYSSADMTRLENLGGGGHTYRRVRVRRRPSAPYPPRLLASNSDGFHSFSVGRGPLVEGCEFSFLGDDFINMHDRLLPVASVSVGARSGGAGGGRDGGGDGGRAQKQASAATLRVVDVSDVLGHGTTAGRGAPTHTMGAVVPGDVLKLFNASTNTLIGTVVVGRTTLLRSPPPPLPASLASRVEPSAIQLWEVTAATASLPPGGVGPFDAVVQLDRLASVGAVIRDNHFHDSYNNVARFAASDLLFESNLVERAEDGVHVSYDIAGSFLEGSLGMRNISIVNNTFVTVSGCGSRRDGTKGCPRVCADVPCVLSHVDVEGVVRQANNTAVAGRA